MVEEELCKEVDRIIGLDLVSFRERLRDNKANLVLLEVADVTVLLIEL